MDYEKHLLAITGFFIKVLQIYISSLISFVLIAYRGYFSGSCYYPLFIPRLRNPSMLLIWQLLWLPTQQVSAYKYSWRWYTGNVFYQIKHWTICRLLHLNKNSLQFNRVRLWFHFS